MDDRAAALAAAWESPADPTTGISSDRIGLDLSAARAVLKVRGVPVEATNPLASVDLIAPESGRGLYAVAVRSAEGERRREIHLFRSFTDLADELLRQLQAGNGLKLTTLHGRYSTDNEVNELTTARASFEFVAIN